MADLNHLYGSCACERNQYTVIIPSTSASQAQVFFDNSAATRRSQATPVTAWLRVPLDWFHSSTYALFPDETQTSIRRIFNTASAGHPDFPTRRQFCGYCGTHLTAWNEAFAHSADYLDVTLGSLMNESIQRLEALNIIPDTSEDDDGLVKGGMIDDEDHIPMDEDDGRLVKGGTIDDEDHIPMNEGSMGGVEGPGASTAAAASTQPLTRTTTQHMHNRGMPYFEEMVENSRLGKIKRQRGGHTSSDGRTTVQWEVVEIGGNENDPPDASATVVEAGDSSNKRPKLAE